MRSLTRPFLVAALTLAAGACTDSQARADIQAVKDSLNTWMSNVHSWHGRVANAVCQLEFDVYDVADSGGDTRAAGPTASPGSNRLCSGPGDPVGQPPEPPQL